MSSPSRVPLHLRGHPAAVGHGPKVSSASGSLEKERQIHRQLLAVRSTARGRALQECRVRAGVWSRKSTLRDETDDSSEEGEAQGAFDMLDEEDHGAMDSRVTSTLLRVEKLRGVVPGPQGEGQVASRTAGYGKGVPPAAKVEHCVVVPFTGFDIRHENASSMVLTAASDGVNLGWSITLCKQELAQMPDIMRGRGSHQGEDAPQGWVHLGPMAFWSVFSRFRGVTAVTESRPKRMSQSARGEHRTQAPPSSPKAAPHMQRPRPPAAARRPQTAEGARHAHSTSASQSAAGHAGNAVSVVRRKAHVNARPINLKENDEGGRKEPKVLQRETLRRENDVRTAQNQFLDPVRERFMTTVSHTTVLHALDFEVSKKAMAEIEAKHKLVERVEAEAQAAYAKSRNDHGGIPLTNGTLSTPRILEVSAPRSFEEMMEGRRDSGRRTKHPREEFLTDLTGEQGPPTAGLGWIHELEQVPGVDMLPPTQSTMRQKLALTCIAADQKRPRVATGVGDGQIAIYYLYRAHGTRKRRMHQIQGFDASRRKGDVCTALFLPSKKLEEDGSLAHETVLAGFESGRVAVFRTFLPDDILTGGLKEGSEEALTADRELASGISNGEPVLTVQEPLLLEHYHCSSPVVALFWHPIMGIFSICTFGHVLVANGSGNKTFSIPEACGRNATVTSVDLSLELEQLAIAGQRGVYLWQNLSQAKFGVIGKSQEGSEGENPRQSSAVVLVRYMPSMRFILTVHWNDAEVKIWDARSLDLHTSVKTPDCAYATCAAWDSHWHKVMVFGPSSVAEIQLMEEVLEEVDESSTQRRHRGTPAKQWKPLRPSWASQG
eukprot:TRINITY_DN26810_c0_g1_i1.p1 TRINITY_DN26810_c0_g1~~TRINITY_DN26810_c0_g1_i1.p1  ORF type:complete len:832 (-),score=116.46 TRINITY_DN26810_c0_g1_i1:164-2659(-)